MNFVGYQKVDIIDEDLNINIPVIIMYPTDMQERECYFGPFMLNIAKNAPLKSGSYSLVIISHGSCASGLGYRNLARYLVQHGYIVAIPTYYKDNKDDSSIYNTIENLIYRPKHTKLVIDWVLMNNNFKDSIKNQEISIVGHSMGGYTALALAGGKPFTLPHESMTIPHEVDVTHDQRINKIVLLAPATVWFAQPTALYDVNCQMLILTGEKDIWTPAYQVKIIIDGVLDVKKIKHVTVKNANHFAFVTPFPSELIDINRPATQDPIGFDRLAYQNIMHQDILEFLSVSCSEINHLKNFDKNINNDIIYN